MRRRTLVGFTIGQLVDSAAYLGYGISGWDYRVGLFILGKRNFTYLFNLNFTISFLKNSLTFFFNLCLKRGVCALVNENPNFSKQLNIYFHSRVKKMQRISLVSSKLKRGLLSNYKLFKNRQKIFKILPHVCFVSSPSYSSFFLSECGRFGIPVVSICDSNLFSTCSTYVIPANEKSFKAVLLFNTLFFLYFTRAFLVRTSCFSDRLFRLNSKRHDSKEPIKGRF